MPARIMLEIPIYNYFVQGVYTVVDRAFYQTKGPKSGGADPHVIDLSGRIVSVGFWIVSFLLAQALGVRFLFTKVIPWANGIFVFAPLSVFFGQAVMPEMVFLAACLAFVLAVVRYGERPSWVNFGTLTRSGGQWA